MIQFGLGIIGLKPEGEIERMVDEAAHSMTDSWMKFHSAMIPWFDVPSQPQSRPLETDSSEEYDRKFGYRG